MSKRSRELEREEEAGLSAAQTLVAKKRALSEAHDEDIRYNTADYVEMVKRERGDHFGSFEENWLQKNHPLALTWVPRESRGMVTYPVISRAVRAKIATELATQFKFTVEAVQSDPDLQAVAEKFERMFAYLRRIFWTSNTHFQTSYLRIVGGCCFLFNDFEKNDGIEYDIQNTVPQITIEGNASYICKNCGNVFAPEQLAIQNPIEAVHAHAQAFEQSRPEFFKNTPKSFSTIGDQKADEKKRTENFQTQLQTVTQNAAESEDTSQLVCPACQFIGTLENNHEIEVGEQMIPTGDKTKKLSGALKTQIVSSLLIRADEYNGIGFRLDKCHWFNFNFLAPLYQIRQWCETQDQLDNLTTAAPERWSDAVRWHYELSKRKGNRSAYSQSSLRHSHALGQAELWWWQPVACAGYNAPADEKIGKNFDIKKGETWEQAFLRRGDKKFKGLCALIVGDEVLKVYNEDFREKWTGIAWTVDPHAFYPKGEERLLQIQSTATRVFTMIYNYTMRCAAPKGFADLNYVNREDLETNVMGAWVTKKQDANDTKDVDLRTKIFYLVPPELPGTVDNFVEIVITITKEESGVYDETVGAGNTTNQTASGRQVALSRSLGLQLPSNQAKGDGMCEWAYQALQLCADSAEDEFYMQFIEEDEEEWTATDLAAIRAANIRKQFRIAVVDGSDIPNTREDLEEAYLIAIQSGLFDPASPTPFDVRQALLDIRGIDYDLEDAKKNERIAKRRYTRLKEIIASFPENERVIFAPLPVDPMMPPPATEEEAIQRMQPVPQINPELVNLIASDSVTQIRDGIDAHFIYVKFYKDKVLGLIQQDKPDEVLLMILMEIISQHRGMIAAQMAAQQNIQSLSGATDAGINNAPALKQEAEEREASE